VIPTTDTTDSVLTRIAATLDGLCPCGARPRPGFPYCSPDCTPTHHGSDTGSCAARWRPKAANLDLPVGQRPTLNAEDVAAINATFRRIFELVREFVAAGAPALEYLKQFGVVLQVPAQLPEHPLARIAALRRNQPHGPQRKVRPPRSLECR
jgi:hypothetical protein